MKKVIVLLPLLLSLLMTACDATISESAMETAVSQVILTSSASDTTTNSDEETEVQQEVQTSGDKEELRDAKAALSEAELKLTDQAAQIEDLQAELEGIYPLLTPSITPTPYNTPTPAALATATVRPTATVFTLPYYHKYVTPINNAPLFSYKDKNDSGFPIMLKKEPIIKFVNGDVFVVDINRIRADGGGYFYLVIGPKNAGYYVQFDDVQDYKE